MRSVFLLLLVGLFFSGCNSASDSSLSDDLGVVTPAPSTTGGSSDGGSSGGGSSAPLFSLVVFSGNNQTIGTGLSHTLQVLARNTANSAIANSPVSFQVTSGSGSVSPSVTTTNASGIATTTFTAGVTAGAVTVLATSPEGTATFNLIVSNALSSSLSYFPNSSNGQTANVGATLANNFKVVLEDSNGDPIANSLIRFKRTSGQSGLFAGSVVSYIATTNSLGIAEASAFTLSTIAGDHTITAELVTDTSVSIDFLSTGLVDDNSQISNSLSTVTLSSSSIVANGTNTVVVSVQLKDQYNNTIENNNYGGSITLNSNAFPAGATWTTSWTYDVGLKRYLRTLRAGTTAGTITFSSLVVSGAFGMTKTTSLPALTLTNMGVVDPTKTLLSASSTQIVTNADTILYFTLRDQFNNAIGVCNSETLSLSVSSGSLLATPACSAGVYSQTFRSGGSAGTATITLNTINGVSTGGLSIAINVILGTSGYALDYFPSVGDPTIYNQTGNVGSTLTNPMVVQVTDGSGPVSGVSVEFTSSLSGNKGVFTSAQSVFVTTGADGVATSPTFTLTNSAGTHSVRARISSDPAVFKDFSHTAIVPSASAISIVNSTVTLSSPNITANGSSTTIVRVTIRDQFNNPIPNGSYTNAITLSASPTFESRGSWAENWIYEGSGVYRRTFITGSTASSIILSSVDIASASPVTLVAPSTSTLPLTLTLESSATVDLTQTLIQASVNPLTADGASLTEISVTLRDQFANKISQSGHTIIVSTSAGTFLTSGTTSQTLTYDAGTGTYKYFLVAPASTGIGSLTVTLTDYNGTSAIGFNKFVNVTLNPGSYSAANSTFSVTSIIPITFSSVKTNFFTVSLRDAQNNPVVLSGATVAFSRTAVGAGTGAGVAGTVSNLGAGIYSANLTMPASCSMVACIDQWTATITHASINSGTPTQVGSAIRVRYNGTAIVPSAAHSIYTISSTSQPAGAGASSMTLSITLRDSSAASLMVGGFASNLVVTNTFGATVGTVTDNNDSTYTVVVSSPTTPTPNTGSSISIRYGGAHIGTTSLPASPVNVTFYGTPHASNSFITFSTSTLSGPGNVNVKMTARDINNNLIPTTANQSLANLQFEVVSAIDTLRGSSITNQTSLTGAISGSVSVGEAEYIQTLNRPSSPAIDFETVSVRARIFYNGVWNGTAAASLVITPTNLAGLAGGITCTNIASYRDTSLYISNGILSIDSMINNAIDTSGGCAALGAQPFRFKDIVVDAGGTLTHTAGTATTLYGLDIEATGIIRINATGAIDVSNKGYAAGRGVYVNASTSPTNAAHGIGLCSVFAHATSGSATSFYNSVSDPYMGGIGSVGLSGGGVVRLKAPQIINNGTIYANSGGVASTIPGAGGSIKIETTTGALSGTGLFSASSILASSSGCGGIVWAGTGGRIAIIGSTSGINLNQFSARMAAGVTGVVPGSTFNGTLYFSQPIVGSQTLPHDLFVSSDDTNASVLNTNATTDLIIPSGVTLTLDTPISVSSLTVNGTITHNRHMLGRTNPRISITATNKIIVNASGSINATGRGFGGAFTAHGFTLSSVGTAISSSNSIFGAGLTGGTPCTGICLGAASSVASGGNHLSLGGTGSSANNFTWGSSSDPNSYGGGGGNSNTTWGSGGNGGGIIRLFSTASDIEIYGSVSSNGNPGIAGNTSVSSGGAGGSILISASGTLLGTGTISSAGGAGACFANAGAITGGSGAGGIIRTNRSSESGSISRVVSGGGSSVGGSSNTCVVNAGSAGVSSTN